MKQLHMDDFRQTMYMLPEEHIKKKAKEAMPDLTTGQLDELLKYMEAEKQNNPLALTDGLFNEKGEGQLLVFSMAPNFEMALYLAQITGSLIITDSQHRWGELIQAQSRTSGMVTYNWSELTSKLESLKYPLNANPQVTFSDRSAGKSGKLRAAMHRLNKELKNAPTPSSQLQESLGSEFFRAAEMAAKELRRTETSFSGKFSFLIPHPKGFHQQDVVQVVNTHLSY